MPFLSGLVAHQFFRLVPQKAIEQHGDQWTRPENIVTCGAFKVQSWRSYDRLIVVRDPMYWDAGRVKLDQITFYPVEDSTTQMNLYKAGEVDAVYNHTVPYAWVDELRPLKDYMDKPENAIEYYMLNTKKAPTNDLRVRRAFNMAIDKNALAVYRRVVKPLTAFTPEGIFPGYPQPKGDPFDPSARAQLLAEAGYRDASGKYDPSEVSHQPDGNQLQHDGKQQADRRVRAGAVEAAPRVDGAAEEHRMEDLSRFPREARSTRAWRGPDGSATTWIRTRSSDLFSTETGDNGTGWSRPEVRRDAPAGQHAARSRQAVRAAGQAEAFLIAAQPVIPLYTAGTDWLKKPFVKGMYANPLTLHAWKYVYIEHDPAKWDVEPATTN